MVTTSKWQYFTSLCTTIILILDACTISSRYYCILGISITKVQDIWSVEMLKSILVTCIQWSWHRQKHLCKIPYFRYLLSNQAILKNTKNFSDSLSLYITSFIHMYYSNELKYLTIEAVQSGPMSFIVERMSEMLPSANQDIWWNGSR